MIPTLLRNAVLIGAGLLLPLASAAAQQEGPTQGEGATAQAAPGTFVGLQELSEDALLVEQFGRTVDEIEDMSILTSGGERIGEVDELLLNGEGRIVAVSVEVGGFLGVGDREVVLGLDQLTPEGDAFRVDMTRSEIEGLPSWDD